MKPIKIALAGLCLLALPVLGQADDIEEQIQRGVKAYQDGQPREAIQELQFAISQLQELLNTQYLTLLPAPPEGWEAEDSEAQTMPAAILGGGTSISRSYRRGEEQMEITMVADSPLLASLSMMLSNPAMLAAGGNVRPYRYQSYRGIIEKQDNGTEISLLVANRVLVKLSGDNIEGEKTLEDFLKAMDFKKIEETLAP